MDGLAELRFSSAYGQAWAAPAYVGQLRRDRNGVFGEFDPTPPRIAEPERRRHRCDERCTCPADGKPMFYAPSQAVHACVDPDCRYARPEDLP